MLDFILAIISSSLLILLLVSVYCINWNKPLGHKIFGWCYPDPDKKIGFDGASFTSTCAECKKSIMQDSQGNWF